jgi:heterodisulfide reductase subunit B
VAAAAALGIEMAELPSWYCCGTVYSLASDDLMRQLGPIRTLIQVEKQGDSRVTTLCAMCYNTLKRANKLVQDDKEKLDKINDFMYEEETKYKGGVQVVHLLELLRDELGYEKLATLVKKPLKGLKVATYYGCLLLRPEGIGLDDLEEPTIVEGMLKALGAEVVRYPYGTECCGSYHTVQESDLVVERTTAIIGSAQARGADAVVLSCPLCEFNLDARQKEASEKYPGFKKTPVLYFTQLLALALGLDPSVCRFDLHYVDPRPMLKEKGIV